jgi:hypothetical protein
VVETLHFEYEVETQSMLTFLKVERSEGLSQAGSYDLRAVLSQY